MSTKKNNLSKKHNYPIEGLYQLKILGYWRALKEQPICVWMICLYIMNEYLRAQKIFEFLYGLPISRILLLMTLITWTMNAKEKFHKDSFFGFYLLFFLIILVSSFTAYSPTKSFNNLNLYISWMLIYFLVVQNITTEKRLLIFIWFLFLPIFKMSLFGAKSWTMRGFAFSDWGVSGPEGFFQNSGELSLLMAMFFAMSTGLYIGIKEHLSYTKKLLMLSLPLTAIMTVLASSTRGSQLALLIQMLIFGILFKKFSFRGIIVTVLALSLAYNYLPEEQKQRFESAGSDKTSLARLTYWEKGYEMLNDHPVTGVGYFNFPEYFAYKYPSYVVYEHKGAEVAHNHVVEVAATLGYPGIIVYLLIIYGCYYVAAKTRKILVNNELKSHWVYPFTIGMDCALIGYFIGAMFMSVAFYPYIWIHSALIVATYTATKKMIEDKQTIEPDIETNN